MTLRVRWYMGSITPAVLEAFCDAVANEEYGRGRRKAGFRVVQRRRRALEAEYIERRETEEKVDNPFGTSETFHRIQYVVTRFVVSADSPALEFIDPPRSVADVVQKLSASLGDGGTLVPAAVLPLSWLEAIEAISKDVVVSGMTVEGISLDHAVSAAAHVESSTEVREVVEKWLGRRARNVVALQVQTRGYRLELLTGGRARIAAGDVGEVRALLRRSLAAVVSAPD